MGNLLAHPRTKIPKKACESDEPACDEVGARELGLKNNLKQAEVNALIQYYQRRDPDNDGLLPEEFKEAAGEFIASGLTIDPTVIFNIFDTGAGGIAGRVTLREFILGYAILCRGSAESRLKYLFAIFGDADRSDYLTREQLISSLKLMQRIVSEVSEYQDTPDEENEMQIMTVADTLIAESSESESKRISYGDFIEKLREDEVVNTWLDELSSVAGEHLKYIDKREVDVVELNMEREGLLHAGSTSRRPSFRGMDWTPSPEEPLEAPSAERPPADKKRRIPMPKKQKLVRRDLRRSSLEESAWSPKPDENDDDTYNEGNAARPFVINYDQIEFGKILGRGACATVYKCQWMHVPVAVKVFNDGHGEAAGIDKLATTNEEVRKNVVGDYVEEFWLLLQIRHPNCLLYMGICFEPVVCIVTELYSGGSVANYLHGPNPRKFSPEKALEILCGVARGMYYLHASSPPILHRDLKASNILINQSLTHCVICDFGLSSQFVNEASGLNLHPSRGMSDAGVGGIGTPYTMAPEIMRRNTYKPAADVYSFGIVMYEVYTSRFPYPNMKPIQLMFHVTEKHRPKFYEEDNVPPTMRTLIEKCWSQDPKDRPTFEEILGVLTSSQLENEIFERYRSLITTEPGKQTSNMSLESTPDDLSKNLLEAVYRGQNSIVAQLIDRGANVNYSDYDKRTALHVAAAEGRTTCIRLLISAGARQSYDRWNNSPAVDAGNFEARTGNSEPVRLLRAIEGRSVGNLHEATSQRVLDTHQIEVLRNQAAMMAAVDGDVEAMKRLIEDGLDVNCSDYDRRTPLLVASSEGRREIVKLLLKHGAAVEHRDRWASTACHEAERGGYHDIIRLLRQAGSKLMPTSSREDGSNS